MEYTEMIISSEDYLGKDNAYGAPEVQRINGDYMNSEFILDRIYYGEYTDKDGETYYESYRWEYDLAAEDRNENIVDIQIIVERYENGDYKTG
tara:strand:+ start:261 stop:539 length:279 start_codon:yes stop_codon:yes gene_type:complete